MVRRNQRVISVLLSSALGLILVGWFLGRRAPAGTVRLVSVPSDVERQFRERAEQGSGVHAAESSPTTKRAPLMIGKFNYAELSEELATRMFPSIRYENPRCQYDPFAFFAGTPGLRHTLVDRGLPGGEFVMLNNSLGLRRSTEVSMSKPDLRVLVTGDSHAEGVVPMDRQLTEIAEGILRGNQPERSVEVLNGALGGYSFFNYMGVAEKFKDLRPDVFVVAVYGGNDFTGCLGPYRYFHRLPPGIGVPKKVRPLWNRLMKESSQFFAQSFGQVIRLHYQPRELALAQKATAEFVQEMHGICEANGSQLVLMYLPSLLEAQPQFAEEVIAQALEELNLEYEDLHETSDLANSMLDDARALGVPCIDLRASFRAATEALYWDFDHHLNTAGHALAGRELSRFLDGVVDQ